MSGANPIDAILGLGFGENDEEYTRQLAASLRGSQNMGDALSLSTIPQMQKLGTRMGNRATLQTGQAGSRREGMSKSRAAAEQTTYDRGQKKTALARAMEQQEYDRQMTSMKIRSGNEQEAYSRDQTAQKADALGKPAPYVDAAGNMAHMAQTGGGEFKQVPELDGMTPYNKPSNSSGSQAKMFAPKTNILGVSFMQDPNDPTKRIFSDDGTPYTRAEAIKRAEHAAALEAKAAGDKKYDEESNKIYAEQVTDAEAAAGGMGEVIGLYSGVLSQLPEANIGKIANYFPSFQDATINIENIQEQLGLKKMATVKMAPWSDKDVALLMSSVLPTDLQNSGMKAWLTHRIEAMKRMSKAYQEFMPVLKQYRGNVPPEIQAQQRARYQEITRGDGFDFDTPAAAPPLGDAELVKPAMASPEQWAEWGKTPGAQQKVVNGLRDKGIK